MTPQDLFGVAIRTTGLWIVLYGNYILILAMAWLFSAPPSATDKKPDDKDESYLGGKYFFIGTVVVFMGMALIQKWSSVMELRTFAVR